MTSPRSIVVLFFGALSLPLNKLFLRVLIKGKIKKEKVPKKELKETKRKRETKTVNEGMQRLIAQLRKERRVMIIYLPVIYRKGYTMIDRLTE